MRLYSYSPIHRAIVDCGGAPMSELTISKCAANIIRCKLEAKRTGDQNAIAFYHQQLEELNAALVDMERHCRARVTPNVICRGGDLYLGSRPISREDAAWLHGVHNVEATPEALVQRDRLLKAMEEQDRYRRAQGGVKS